METILVAGANGTTGKKIIHLLKASQYFEPLAMVREENQQPLFENMGVKTVVADLENDLTDAVKGVDKVLFAAGSGGEKVEAVDQNGAIRLIKASIQENIKKFVMLSSLGAANPEAHEELKEYLTAKSNADEFLKSSGLNFAIVRPGTLNNEKPKGKITLAASLDKQGEISREDVAQTLVRMLHDDAAANSTFEIIQGDTLIAKALKVLK